MSDQSGSSNSNADEEADRKLMEEYMQMLDKASKTDFLNITPFHPLYPSGYDGYGRRIVILSGHAINVKAKKEDLISYFLYQMNNIVCLFF